jgi:phospholipase C
MLQAGRTARLYQYDPLCAPLGIDLSETQPQALATYQQFLLDCQKGTLPDYAFVEPSHNDHPSLAGGEELACDQHPAHDVQAGEVFIATIYNAIRQNPDLWKSTALLIVYAEHGGIFDHVPPPSCVLPGRA